MLLEHDILCTSLLYHCRVTKNLQKIKKNGARFLDWSDRPSEVGDEVSTDLHTFYHIANISYVKNESYFTLVHWKKI